MSGEATDSCLREGIVAADRQVRAAQPPTFAREGPGQGPHAGSADADEVRLSHTAQFEDFCWFHVADTVFEEPDRRPKGSWPVQHKRTCEFGSFLVFSFNRTCPFLGWWSMIYL